MTTIPIKYRSVTAQTFYDKETDFFKFPKDDLQILSMGFKGHANKQQMRFSLHE